VPHFVFDGFNTAFKAVSAVTFGAKAKAVSTSNAVEAHIFLSPILITQLAFPLLAPGLT
jgi:hypothetical protein